MRKISSQIMATWCLLICHTGTIKSFSDDAVVFLHLRSGGPWFALHFHGTIFNPHNIIFGFIGWPSGSSTDDSIRRAETPSRLRRRSIWRTARTTTASTIVEVSTSAAAEACFHSLDAVQTYFRFPGAIKIGSHGAATAQTIFNDILTTQTIAGNLPAASQVDSNRLAAGCGAAGDTKSTFSRI